MALYDNLIQQYSIQKTLRWELKPIGKTLDYMTERRIIEIDEKLADDYKKIKKIIDRYHIKVVTEALAEEKKVFSEDKLNNYVLTVNENGNVEPINAELRKIIVKALESHDDFEILFGEKLVKEHLPQIAENDDELRVIAAFNRFTTALKNYHTIRQNMYSAEEKRSTVAYRIVNENLPKFVNNIRVYEKVKTSGIDFNECLQKQEMYLGGIELDKVFSITTYYRFLNQKGIDWYNQIIGGVATENSKIQGLNEIINLWNQTHSNERLPMFSPLFKQILCDTNTESFVLNSFETDEEVLDELQNGIRFAEDLVNGEQSVLNCFNNYVNQRGVFVKNDASLSSLSLALFDNWHIISDGLSKEYGSNYRGKKKQDTEAYEEEKTKALKSVKSFSLEEIARFAETDCILELVNRKLKGIADDVLFYSNKLKTAIDSLNPERKELIRNEAFADKVKLFLDALKTLQQFTGLFSGTGLEPLRDNLFYADFASKQERMFYITGLYNKTRNYFTKKTYSLDKIKLNFDSPTLLEGWDKNKEANDLGVLFVKDGLYYLGLIDKNNKKIFKDIPEPSGNEPVYDKMEYKLLPGPNKNLPRIFFSKRRIGEFAPSDEIIRIKETESFKKGANFLIDDCRKMIDFYKESISKYEEWSGFGFQFSDTSEYKDISGFYKEVEKQGYKISFRKVSDAYINQLVNEGKLYLFQIQSKDFSEFSKGNPNLQTIYWKMLFDERNLGGDIVYKLNGEAEIFFRKASINKDQKPTHRKGEAIANKNPYNPKKDSVFDYDLIKDKRFTMDKLFFHCPISINFVNEGHGNLNEIVNTAIRSGERPYVIGIDRGERNLLYVVVIDPEGNIVQGKQFSLNQIDNIVNGTHYQVDYHKLLDEREKERDAARKNWKSINQIKDLKTGYLSRAIHSITELAIQYNAIIVLEDLNYGFMRGRQKIEKQVYQEFERMLIQKLNFLVTKKNRQLDDVLLPGGALRAYQLTNQFESFSRLGRQTGVLFYIPAWNTSKMDPTTGFVNLFNMTYETIDKTKRFFEKMDLIRYNATEDLFEFSINYSNYTDKANETKEDWVICTAGERLENRRDSQRNNQFYTRLYNPTEEMKMLLTEYGIDYTVANLKQEVLNRSEADFYKRLFKVFKMTLQIRNSRLASESGSEDYLQSCVRNQNGEFYNSNKAGDALPKDADANGAYNIARKGLMIIERIQHTEMNKTVDMKISNKDWLKYAQSHC